ncbi:MAG: ATP synthase F1 subunit delta [Spirochaetes bacterium]|nr:ATP synthase F1 subunit delta [Spirochaetota bacterium]
MAANDISRVYALSLVEVGQGKNVLPDLEEEMKFLSDLFTSDRDVRQYLISPAFSKESKREFVKKVFTGKLSDYVTNLLNVLIENDRQEFIPKIYEAMTELIDETQNRLHVSVTTTSEMDASLKESIVEILSKKFNKQIVLKEKIDESIMGGIIIRIGDTVIDGSLVKDLKNIRKNLLISKVRSGAAYED